MNRLSTRECPDIFRAYLLMLQGTENIWYPGFPKDLYIKGRLPQESDFCSLYAKRLAVKAAVKFKGAISSKRGATDAAEEQKGKLQRLC